MSDDSQKLVDSQNKIVVCPQCGHSPSESQAYEWVDVARVSNLAEAGFLSDELNGVGLESRVHQLDEFSAASDRWSSRYLIRVPEHFAREAASHIEKYLFEEENGRRPILDVMRNPLGRNTNEPLSWRPVLLVVIAGIASFALGQRFSEHAPPRRPRAEPLSTAIAAINKRFTTEPMANQPRHRLSIDQRQKQWTLETDRDNDGVYDETRHFPTAPIR